MNRVITTYAPVIIPTLNRNIHFKHCLESLERCSGADNTEVYVALDYPPSDKYNEGWKAIDEYLSEKEKKHRFKQLHVIRRDHNFGVCHEDGNFESLVRDIQNCYDRYILTEDDNEFSPCFLDFMNQALEKYKDNPKIYSVCGYNQDEYFINEKSIVFLYDNSAWGLGRWSDKFIYDKDYLHAAFCKPSNVLKIWRTYPILLLLCLSIMRKKRNYADAVSSVKCICEDLYQLRPSLSMVRNCGDDGSGLHSGASGRFSKQKISDDENFDLPNVSAELTKELKTAVYNNMMPQTILRRVNVHIKIAIGLLLYYCSRH